MAIDLQTAQKLPEAEDQTRTFGFEEAAANMLVVRRGHCPQCFQPMGIQGVQGKATIKVATAEGIDYWCENCFKKGEAEGTCIKYRSMDKKERKALRKFLKKQHHDTEN
jgi:hypothetical protein